MRLIHVLVLLAAVLVHPACVGAALLLEAGVGVIPASTELSFGEVPAFGLVASLQWEWGDPGHLDRFVGASVRPGAAYRGPGAPETGGRSGSGNSSGDHVSELALGVRARREGTRLDYFAEFVGGGIREHESGCGSPFIQVCGGLERALSTRVRARLGIGVRFQVSDPALEVPVSLTAAAALWQ